MIGLFDSGVGGLSVLRELREKAPGADILYFGDIAHAPYGPRTTEELVVLTLKAMALLRERGVNQFVSACNSVSVSVIQPIVALFGASPGHIIEMVGPVARAVKKSVHGKILVIATEATVRSGLYERTFLEEGMRVEMLAVPDLAFAIESGATKEELIRILKPVVSYCSANTIDTLVLGCTHFPLVVDLLSELIRKGVTHSVQVVDPSSSVVQETIQQFDTSGTGSITFILSQDSETFRSYVKMFFGDENRIEILPPVSVSF